MGLTGTPCRGCPWVARSRQGGAVIVVMVEVVPTHRVSYRLVSCARGKACEDEDEDADEDTRACGGALCELARVGVARCCREDMSFGVWGGGSWWLQSREREWGGSVALPRFLY